MPRWRRSTWAFIGFNVLMMAWAGSTLSDGCVWGTGCEEKYGFFNVLFALLVIAFLWLLGLLVLAVAWLRNRPPGSAAGPDTPRVMRSVTGMDADAVIAEAAVIVGELDAQGRSLVEAAWTSGRRTRSDEPLRLELAFGDSSIGYWALWPNGEDAKETVLARMAAGGSVAAALA